MNQFWLWFMRGAYFRPIHKTPFTGMLGEKKWNDTRKEKTGKNEFETKENGWDDEGEIWD